MLLVQLRITNPLLLARSHMTETLEFDLLFLFLILEISQLLLQLGSYLSRLHRFSQIMEVLWFQLVTCLQLEICRTIMRMLSVVPLLYRGVPKPNHESYFQLLIKQSSVQGWDIPHPLSQWNECSMVHRCNSNLKLYWQIHPTTLQYLYRTVSKSSHGLPSFQFHWSLQQSDNAWHHPIHITIDKSIRLRSYKNLSIKLKSAIQLYGDAVDKSLTLFSLNFLITLYRLALGLSLSGWRFW